MKKIIKIFIMFFCPLALISCSSALPPKSLISTPYFEVISPWDEKCYLDSKNYEVIELRRGNFGSDRMIADYPVKEIIVLRRTIKVSTDDDQLLEESIKRDVLTKTKSLITEQTYGRGYDDNSLYLEFKSHNGNDYYEIVYKNHLYDRICLAQSYIYIPKYYKAWEIYYLFFYHEHPRGVHGSPSLELEKTLKGFKCIEDSIQEKQRPARKG